MVNHHPPDEYLLEYAAGTLPEGPALVVAGHLNYCAMCRATVRDGDFIGGILLHDVPAQPLVAERVTLPTEIAAAPRPAVVPPGTDIPSALRYAIGNRLADIRWRTFWPGMQATKVKNVGPADTRLLRLFPGKGLPVHTHSGNELTLVLDGSFTDEAGHYDVGDVAIGDRSMTHSQMVDSDGPCICLTTVEGPLRFQGWRARLGALLLYR